MTTNKLSVNHDLINTKFQSYRFNRDVKCKVAAQRLPDGSKVHSFKLNSSDYSYCHAAMSSAINHLYHDRHDPSKVYLITEGGEVLGPVLTQNDNEQLDLKSVFTIPDFNAKSMNASLSFPSKSKAIVLLSSRQDLQKVNVQLPGNQLVHLERNRYQVKLFILKRHSSPVSENWEIEFSLDIPEEWLCSSLNIINSSHLHLFDSTFSNNTTLLLVIGSVYECFQLEATSKNKVKSRFGAIFHQIQIDSSSVDDSTKWEIFENNRFVDDARMSNDFPKYAFLGNNNDIVFVCNFKMKCHCLNSAAVDFPKCGDAILIATEELNEQLVDEETLREVEQAETEAIKKAKFTKAVFDEYESCDLQDSASSLVMTRFDCRSGRVLQEFDFSAQQWLFSLTNYSPQNRLPFFVTRHDVDAFIYEPQSIMSTDTAGDSGDQELNDGAFTVQHIDSFPAFGYVFASKQNRRFVTFCQKISSSKTVFNNAVIDNWIDQLLYVYNKPLNQESPTTGQQFLFYFNSNEAPKTTERTVINGLCALPSVDTSTGDKSPKSANQEGAIYVLTEDTLYLIQF